MIQQAMIIHRAAASGREDIFAYKLAFAKFGIVGLISVSVHYRTCR